MLQNLIISTLSGFIGVVVGAVIQIFYNNNAEKKRLLHEYKKTCVAEWLGFAKEVNVLLETPHKHNSTIFRQAIIQKTQLLNFIKQQNKNEVEQLQENIRGADERISLGNFAEEALNIGKIKKNKTALIREVYSLVNIVLNVLSSL